MRGTSSVLIIFATALESREDTGRAFQYIFMNILMFSMSFVVLAWATFISCVGWINGLVIIQEVCSVKMSKYKAFRYEIANDQTDVTVIFIAKLFSLSLKMGVFWHGSPCSLVDIGRRFWCFYRRIIRTTTRDYVPEKSSFVRRVFFTAKWELSCIQRFLCTHAFIKGGAWSSICLVKGNATRFNCQYVPGGCNFELYTSYTPHTHTPSAVAN